MTTGRWMRSGWATLAVTLLAAGCGDDPSSSATYTVTAEEGNGQSAEVGSVLNGYTVRVTNDAGDPQSGVTVTWDVSSGGGSVAPSSSLTDGDGLASAVATLGTTAGAQVVRAEIVDDDGVTFSSSGTAGPVAAIEKAQGDGQAGAKGIALTVAPTVRLLDQYGNAVTGGTISWTPQGASGTVTAPTSVSNGDGVASTGWVLGATAGPMALSATATGVDSILFRATATSAFTILGGGNNVPQRFTSDLWLADGYGYTGSWGARAAQGNAVAIWQLDGAGVPILRDSILTPNLGTVSDIEVSPDGKWLVFTGEGGTNRGIHVYELTSPGTAVFRAKSNNATGLHTGALAVIGGTLYAFAAKDPANCALVIYDLSAAASGTITQASSTAIPDNYCIHDTFVRDGYAFVFAWNSGLYIFDVGNGSNGGTPAAPVPISHTTGYGGETHNGWWFWNPNTAEKRYLFIGEEGPGTVGASSSGSIHVVDVSNLAAPTEVGFFALPGAGVHNFWMDEQQQILYAAYYNGGVVALDVSGTLSGDLGTRMIANLKPGGNGNTYVWGVMLYGNALYASDMVSGLWQLGLP